VGPRTAPGYGPSGPLNGTVCAVRMLDTEEGDAMPILWIIIIVAVLLFLFGGVGYGRRDTWGGYYGGGLGFIGVILLVLLVLWLLGVLR